jgi:hypothetical protein
MMVIIIIIMVIIKIKSFSVFNKHRAKEEAYESGGIGP